MSRESKSQSMTFLIGRAAGLISIFPVSILLAINLALRTEPVAVVNIALGVAQAIGLVVTITLVAACAAHLLVRNCRDLASHPFDHIGDRRIPREIQDLIESGRRARDEEAAARERAVVQSEIHASALSTANQELTRSRELAQAANRAKDAFLAHMSHEIRTPMTTILGNLSMLDEADITPRQRTTLQRSIRVSADHLLSLVSDLLDLSQIESGTVTIQPRPITVVQEFEEVVALMRPRAVAKGIVLNSEASFPLPARIVVDPLRLRQILLNLIANAIRYTNAGGVRISLSCDISDPRNPFLRFDVADTGEGIESQRLAEIFEPFPEDKASHAHTGGVGVGLAISRRLAELLGARLEVISTPGVGSVFSLVLPIAADQVQMLASPRAKSRENPPLEVTPFALENIRILYCEDGAENQRLVKFILSKAGAQVTLAENGRVGVDAFLAARKSAAPFDLVLMDMQMPVLDGYSATAELRRHGVETPILALTAHALTGDRERCLAAGCDDYATKPIDRRGLIALCASWTSRIFDPPDLSSLAA